MSILDFSTRRPVAVSMLTAAVLLFGLVAVARLNVTLLPDLSYPTVTIRTNYAGAAPGEMETLISKPIEEALGIVRGLRQIRSVSRAGQSDVTLEFEWGTLMDFAVLDVREKLDPLELPKEADRPIVLRFDPASDPVLRYGLSVAGAQEADIAALKRLRRIAEDSLQKPLEAVTGVAAVKISGGLEDEVQILLDLQRVARLELTAQQIIARLRAENVNLSGGRVEEGSLRYLVRTRNQFASLDDMRELILANRAGRVVYLRDVAEVRAGFREREAIIRIDGREAVEIALYREGDSNTVAVAENVSARLEQLAKALPADLSLTPLYDQSVYIRQAISGVLQAGLLGGLLAVLVLYLFLKSAWSTFVIAAAIPVSVIATFIVMYASGLTLNIMSLGGIALAIGLLVDSAIVVLESIARRREAGDEPGQAARSGAAQVAAAIIASTLTTIAVFFPMVFVSGIAGQLFSDQALVVSGALAVSLVVALTLIPMLAARAGRVLPIRPAPPLAEGGRLRRGASRLRIFSLESLPAALLYAPVLVWRVVTRLASALMAPLAAAFRRGFAALERAYVPALRGALARRASIVVVALLLFGVALVLLQRVGVELLPPLTQGEFQANIELDPGTPLARSDEMVRAVQLRLSGLPQIRTAYSVAGTGNRLDADPEAGGEHRATLNVVLADPSPAGESTAMAQVRAALAAQPGARYTLTRPTLFSFDTPLEVEIAGFDLEALALYARQIESHMRAAGRFADIKSTLVPGQPEIRIDFDQERAAALGLQVPDLAERVVQAVQGRVATRYRLEDREIDILVRGDDSQRASIEALRRLTINPESSRPIPLSAVASIELALGPGEIRRIDQQRVVVVSAELAYGDLGSGVAALNQLLRETRAPHGLAAVVTGQSEEMAVSFASLQFALALAVFLVYLVMAAQFESLLHPFVILFTIPLAGIGAVFAWVLTGTIINVVVLIGLIVLAGIVVNNAIVLLDRIHQLRAGGLLRDLAVVEAGRERLRPILMTTLTTVLGLLPMAVGGGEGAELRAPLAVTVMGGLLVSTLLTLFVIPVVYTLLDFVPDPAAESEA